MLRTVIIFGWTILVTLYFGTLVLVFSFLGKSERTLHKIASIWAESILICAAIRVKVRGFSRIEPEKPCIYMSNHLSYFDIPVLLAFLAVQFRWLAKSELFRIPIFGVAMKRAGYISIDRGDRDSAIKSIHLAAQTIRHGNSVLIFPEGTRSDDGKLRSFKKGGFVLAIEAGVPVVPIIVRGTREIMPKNRSRIRRGSVVMEILPPIETRTYTYESKEFLMDKVRKTILSELREY